MVNIIWIYTYSYHDINVLDNLFARTCLMLWERAERSSLQWPKGVVKSRKVS